LLLFNDKIIQISINNGKLIILSSKLCKTSHWTNKPIIQIDKDILNMFLFCK